MHDWVLTREGNETEIVKSMISLKWMALTTKTVVAIDFYRLIDTIDVNQKVTIDNYRFIEWSSDIGFYRLH